MDGPVVRSHGETHAPPPAEVGVADRDACVREGMCALLETCGFSVRSFSEADALPAAEEPPECLVLDVDLPGLRPSERSARVRALAARSRVIVTAVCPDVSLVADLLRAGAMDVLEKPFAPDRLIGLVRTALNRRVPTAP